MRLNNLTKRIDALEQIEDNWPNIRTAIVQALDPRPEAKKAVIAMLEARRKGDVKCDLFIAILDALSDFSEAIEAIILALRQSGWNSEH